MREKDIVWSVFINFIGGLQVKTFIFAFAALLLLLVSPPPSDAKAPLGAYWLPEVARNLPDDFIFFEGCVRPLKIKNGKVYFLYSVSLFDGSITKVFDFPKNQLIEDPRETKRWKRSVTRNHKTLWEAIEECAGTWHMPDVTRKILNGIIGSGVVKRNQLRKLTSANITRILVRYTRFVAPTFFIESGSDERAVFLLGVSHFRLMHSRTKVGVVIMRTET